MSSASQAAELPLQPVVGADEHVGVNGALAAALTRAVGSMPALYAVVVIVSGWMILATWGPLYQVDHYPFPFLLFLNNVVQLVLCSVILVGQRVLGMAADRRAVQTYESTEAIFGRVADLQAHLDRHDRALAFGVSLLETTPHPWVQRHRVQPPPQAIDQVVGVNGKIAAWLTQRLGSMWAFYVAAGSQLLWIGLAELRLQRFDPYPFAFMSFLSTLAQLIFMIVIMVGQDVLGRAADRRSEQTFLDAEAILHECGRMKARLIAQDRILDCLADYTTAHVTEHLAQAIHTARLQAAADHVAAHSSHGLRPWHELPEELKESGRAQARQVGERLAAVGCLMVPASGPAAAFTFTDDEAHLLARLDHNLQTTRAAHEHDPMPPDQLPWDQLPDWVRAQRTDAARGIPAMLAEVGFQVLRDSTRTDASLTEPDFTTTEWATLQRAMMAAGVLVALSEGVADADEIYALVRTIREASISHPNRFIRELTAACTFTTGLRPGTTLADYEGPALETIRSASAILARKTPDELPDFRELLVHIAAVVADANNEGGFFGLGARPRTPHEAAAMQAVEEATDISR